jgi:hypothetical protein
MIDDDSSVQILLLALQISRTKLQQFKGKINKNRTNTKMQRQPKKLEKKKKSLFITYPIQLHSLFHFHRIQLWLHNGITFLYVRSSKNTKLPCPSSVI